MVSRWFVSSTLLLSALALAGCGRGGDGALAVAVIDDSASLFANGVRLSAGAQHLRAATDAGLVAFDSQGEVIPALADQWIVTDDGRSYIFRLRNGTWPDGRQLSADSARTALREAIARLSGTSLGLDLAPIAEVRAMAGRVIEIRLSSPAPTLLQLLAQPELALARGVGGSGDMVLERHGDAATLAMKPPLARGIPEASDWAQYVRTVAVEAAPAREAVARFDDGEVDLVLGGRIGALPLVDTGPLSRGTVRLDPALGLFGLQVRRAQGPLASPEVREALAMALDREALVESFGVGGWVPTTRLVAPGLPDDPGLVGERWTTQDLDARRAAAASRIAAWRRGAGGAEARVTIALPAGEGYDVLFRALAGQFAAIGLGLDRRGADAAADLVLVDRIARYAEPRWFLNQFNCSLRGGLCSPEADALVAEATRQADAAPRAALYAEAETELLRLNGYIAFGSPLRFSLVRGDVDAFAANPWAFHPLPPLAVIPR